MKYLLLSQFFRKSGLRAGCFPAALVYILLLGTLLSGCAVGPDYAPLEPDLPGNWHAELGCGLTASGIEPEAMSRWWSLLNDSILDSLEDRAIKGNLDVKTARARIRQARAVREIERSALFPLLGVSGSGTRIRSSENAGATGEARSLFNAGFDASWELDIFGGARRAVEAAQADLEAAGEDLGDVLVTLAAEVALNYVEVRTYQTRLAVISDEIKSQQEIYYLNQSRHEAGIINELAVQQSLYNLESTRSKVPALETGLAAAKNSLAVLLGENPGSLEQELSAARPVPAPPLSVAVGIPAETIRRRPDIRSAERNLAAATARVGVATSALYPRFSLTGGIGLESLKGSTLVEWASRTWNIGSVVNWNIFDAGAIRAGIEVQNAVQEQAMIRYEAAVLNALEETENALVTYVREYQTRESLQAAREAAFRAYELANSQYMAGLVDFSNVLDAQRSLQTFDDQLAVSEGAITSNLIRLYKAVGGGWTSLAEKTDISGLGKNK